MLRLEMFEVSMGKNLERRAQDKFSRISGSSGICTKTGHSNAGVLPWGKRILNDEPDADDTRRRHDLGRVTRFSDFVTTRSGGICKESCDAK